MTHPSDDDLVLHVYGESEDAPGLDAHLAECASCRGARAGILDVLQRVTEDAPPPRGPAYGRAVWDRLQLPLRAARPRPRPLARWGAAAALAASLVLAFLLGRASHEREDHLAAVTTTAPPVRERILLVAVGEHLERSRMVLLEIENAPRSRTIDISSERGRAQELLSANRLYRQAAHTTGEPAVASVLEELERVLLEVATSPDHVSAGRLDEIQQRIADQGIVFKLRVLGAEAQEPRPPVVPITSRSQS